MRSGRSPGQWTFKTRLHLTLPQSSLIVSSFDKGCAGGSGYVIPCFISLPQLTSAPFRDRETTGDEAPFTKAICRGNSMQFLAKKSSKFSENLVLSTGLIMWIGHRKEIRWPIHIINPVVKPDYLAIPPPTQHHSFFRNLPQILRQCVRISLPKNSKKVLRNSLQESNLKRYHCRSGPGCSKAG